MNYDEVKCLIEEFFNGKFEVKKFLGEGSFAKVYLVNHNYLDTLMAMKIVKEPLSITTNRKDVFREVTLACQLRHENIISIYDAAEISDFEDGKNHAYFMMEYVSGGDLGQYLNSFVENDIFMPIDRSLDLISQILNGLDTLHSSNPPIIHRDLKPNNVLLSFNACGDIIIKISDFGFAKEVTTSISDIDIAGTRPYMAPELFNKEVSTRSDIYAVGVMFYQLLTNRYPYDIDGYTNEELIDLKPWEEDLKAPSHYNGNVFADLDDIVMKSLSQDSSDRYGDAGEMLVDVEKAIDKFKSTHITDKTIIDDDYNEYENYIINDSIKRAFHLAKSENGLDEAIEILENEVLNDYEIRRFYSETLRIWKSQRPDLKLISKAFTINLKARNYEISSNLLREAAAYNPSIRGKCQDYIDLWDILIDLNKHKSLFKATALLENLMESSSRINDIYREILPTLKTCSVEEIVAKALSLVGENRLFSAANLMEFAVIVNSQIRQKYEYMMSLWKQNMMMNLKASPEVKGNAIDYGIDLGTTDSVISYFNDGNPIIIPNHLTGGDFTPSAIMIDGDDNIEVGVNARDAIFENDANAVSEFKNNMGFQVPFKFEKSSRVMFPEELSAEVLKDLRVSVYMHQDINIEDAVICVPANSNPIKTKSIIDAAQLAGFRSCSLILEPVAVSLAYGLKKSDGIWMIYDMGGATFNVTLIRERDGGIEMFATSGLDNLGGNIIDWKIVNDLFKPQIASDLKLDDFTASNSKYHKEFARLKNAGETAKKQLANSTKADIVIDNLFEGYDFRYCLTWDDFRRITSPLMEHTFKMSRMLLEDNNLRDGDIEKIILVGGSTINPIIQDMIAEEFDIEMESGLNPLTVVAKGASVYAGSLKRPSHEIKKQSLGLLLDVVNGEVRGRLFAEDLKSSFLGYVIEFKNDSSQVRIASKIDGRFNFKCGSLNHEIRVYRKDEPCELDLKSPNRIDDNNVYMPYFGREFAIRDNLNPKDLINRYSNLLARIEFLRDYSDFSGREIQEYIEILLEIIQRDDIALTQADIYIGHLERLVVDAENDLEFSMLLENVLGKIEIIENKNLFETDSISRISESRDMDGLKGYYSDIIERYVALNSESVIEQCFFNLKLDGIFSNNRELADELIARAQDALNINDYEVLFDFTNRLHELDERGDDS